jgi:hypothetical protein
MSTEAQTNRAILDNDLIVSVALPNAGNTVNTNGIDLGETRPCLPGEQYQVKISTTAGTAANNKNITIVVQDSADNSTFANIATLGSTLINEGSSSYAATTAYYSLPSITRRYVRASASGEADGGNAADGTLTLSLVF